MRDLVSYGTEEAICRIVETYSDMLLRLASTRLRNAADAEDVVQEVFLRLMERSVVFRDAEHEKAWLIRATLHRASDFRRRASAGELPLEEAACAAAPETTGNALVNAVRALPEKYSAVIFLHYYEGYTIQEIGSVLGIPPATAGTRLARGRKRLRSLLEEDEA